ncbi:MAG: hypothetical protein OXI38_08665 [Bacteroidota bacterium]|nr:hypothetical protein [Bacteroidota bacterium]
MVAKAVVYVEGPSDQRFMNCLLDDFGLAEDIEIRVIGGGIPALRLVALPIRRAREAGKDVAIILDADENPAEQRAGLERELDALEVEVSSSFLIPNDADAGCLETLLEQSVHSEHRAVMNYFERYKSCLDELTGPYELPLGKAKIYAYCLAVGTPPQPAERDYLNRDYWNLDAPTIKPLKEFLSALAVDSGEADP